jgi:hypothetical protein
MINDKPESGHKIHTASMKDMIKIKLDTPNIRSVVGDKNSWVIHDSNSENLQNLFDRDDDLKACLPAQEGRNSCSNSFLSHCPSRYNDPDICNVSHSHFSQDNSHSDLKVLAFEKDCSNSFDVSVLVVESSDVDSKTGKEEREELIVETCNFAFYN